LSVEGEYREGEELNEEEQNGEIEAPLNVEAEKEEGERDDEEEKGYEAEDEDDEVKIMRESDYAQEWVMI
jgi:hypothetical protein